MTCHTGAAESTKDKDFSTFGFVLNAAYWSVRRIVYFACSFSNFCHKTRRTSGERYRKQKTRTEPILLSKNTSFCLSIFIGRNVMKYITQTETKHKSRQEIDAGQLSFRVAVLPPTSKQFEPVLRPLFPFCGRAFWKFSFLTRLCQMCCH